MCSIFIHCILISLESCIVTKWPAFQFQAAQNLVVLSREDAGAEQIFRNDGVKLTQKLLHSKQEDVVLSALRTLVGMCTGHQSRVSVTIPSEGSLCIIFKVLFLTCIKTCV